jgi:serine/threonine protein kinase
MAAALASLVFTGEELSLPGIHSSRVLRATNSSGKFCIVKTFAVADIETTQPLTQSAGTLLATNEMSIQKRLSTSPYISAVTSIIMDHSRLSMIGNYANGGNLESVRRRARDGVLSSSAISWIALSTARALEHAHSLGIIHTNLRPSNILLTSGSWSDKTAQHDLSSSTTLRPSSAPLKTPRVLPPPHLSNVVNEIIDSGSTSSIDKSTTPCFDIVTSAEVTNSNILVCDFLTHATLRAREAAGGGGASNSSKTGAMLYLAPELLRDLGDAPTPACDIWSLGSIVFTLSTGTFLAATGEMRALLRRGDWSIDSFLTLPLTRTRWDRLPESLRDLITRCLSIDPRDRPTAIAVTQHDALAFGCIAERSSSSLLSEMKITLADALIRLEKAETLASERAIHTSSLLQALTRAESMISPSVSLTGTRKEDTSNTRTPVRNFITPPHTATSIMTPLPTTPDATITPPQAAVKPLPPTLHADASPEDLIHLLTADDCVHEELIVDTAIALRAYAARSENRKDVAINAGAAIALVAALKIQAASATAAVALSNLIRTLAEGRGEMRRSTLLAAGAVSALITSLNMLDFCRNEAAASTAESYYSASLAVIDGLHSLGYTSNGVEL